MFSAELSLLRNGTVPRTGFQHLRTGIAAGSSIPSALMRTLHEELNLTQLTICYGMTETSPVSAMTTTDDPLERRIDSVGKLLPHVEAKIVDVQDPGRIVEVGEKGELAVSGYLVMKEYFRDPERTKEVLITDESGKVWMHVRCLSLSFRHHPLMSLAIQTGDEALLSPEGYIHITGRIKDLIIRGGENIAPLEIENCLFAHPLIQEASVVGLKDERYGEVVAAFLILREQPQQGTHNRSVDDGKGAEAGTTESKPQSEPDTPKHLTLSISNLKAFVSARLAHHLIPKYIFAVREYPKTASGKVQKFVLREMGERVIAEKGGEERWRSDEMIFLDGGNG